MLNHTIKRCSASDCNSISYSILLAVQIKHLIPQYIIHDANRMIGKQILDIIKPFVFFYGKVHLTLETEDSSEFN